MAENNIENSPMVLRLKRLVKEYGSQRAAAEALGEKGFQSSISNALAGKRMPSEAVRKALDEYYSQRGIEQPESAEAPSGAQGILNFSLGLPIEKTTPKYHLLKETSDEGFIVTVYAPKARVGSSPPKDVTVAVTLTTTCDE